MDDIRGGVADHLVILCVDLTSLFDSIQRRKPCVDLMACVVSDYPAVWP